MGIVRASFHSVTKATRARYLIIMQVGHAILYTLSSIVQLGHSIGRMLLTRSNVLESNVATSS